MAKMSRAATADESVAAELAKHPIMSMPPADIRAWVGANAATSAGMRTLLGWLAVAVVLLVRKKL